MLVLAFSASCAYLLSQVSQRSDEEMRALREAFEALRAHDAEATDRIEQLVLAQRAELTRRERLASLGQLVGSIAHELRNPLGVIESSAYLLRERSEDTARSEKHLDRIADQVRRANAIIADLLELLRDTPRANEPLDLAHLTREVIESLGAAGELIRTSSLEGLPTVRGDHGQLRLVFRNLLANAVDASATVARISAAAGADAIEISIEDDGRGVDAELLPRLFEPLATTRPNGTGLGLALVKLIVERHGGSVRHEAPPRGARFILRLPRSGESA